MELSAYLVPGADVEVETEVRRSRFRCRLVRVESEEEARAVVERARSEHWQARHHCSAFVIGPEGRLARSSDDGEPAGTAGAPMLEAVRGAGVSDVAVVVTRWFGGTLLGAGGLVRAYGDSVRGVEYAVRARLHLAAPAGQDLVAVCLALTSGRGTPERTGEEWVDGARTGRPGGSPGA